MARLYRELADVYDAVYSFKDYATESRRVAEVARREQRTDGDELLDLGCGTGEHIAHLRRWFDCTGVDVSREMLQAARRKRLGATFRLGDMRTLRLRREFDVVVSLFSAIGYMRTTRDLRAAAATLAAHTKPGGVVIVEPWLTPSTFRGRLSLVASDGDDLKLARVGRSVRRGRLSLLDMHYLVARPGRPVEHIVDRQELRLWSHEEMLEAFARASLAARFRARGLMPGRGLYVARKPLG